MGATITHAGGTISPTSLSEWRADADANTIVHVVLNRSATDITFRAPGLRRGTLTLTFADGATAYAARMILLLPEVFTLTHDVVAQVGMPFVVADGKVSDILGKAGDWTLTVPFVEVTP